MIPSNIIIAAMLAQGLGTFLLLLVLGRRRLPLVEQGEVLVKDIALNDEGWPEDAIKASNAFNNQFQLPILFFVACGLSLYMAPGWLEAALAAAFVVTRAIHAGIHVTTNYVPARFLAYSAGFAVLAVFWLWLVVKLVRQMAGA